MSYSNPQRKSLQALIPETPKNDAMDPTWFSDLESAILYKHPQLIERVIASRNFVKSSRLSSFLMCVRYGTQGYA